ncbi:hypothetical protein M2403_000489 [Rahnella sp. BIGb0603]|nr:hypothetical protein [Rahnella sp. BIGb0603]
MKKACKKQAFRYETIQPAQKKSRLFSISAVSGADGSHG